MKKEERSGKLKIAAPISIALGITAVVFGVGAWVFVEKRVWCLSGNEIGDFFAGFAGALALVWIIATIFLQKEELELQRKEVARLADEAVLQSSSLKANAKTFFMDRWENGTLNFAAESGKSFFELIVGLIQEQKDNGGIEQALKSKAEQKFPQSKFDSIANYGQIILHDFSPSRDGYTSYVLQSDLNASVLMLSTTVQPAQKTHHDIPLGQKFEIKNEFLRIKLAGVIDRSEYVRDLIREGLSLGLESMMRSYSIQQASRIRRPKSIGSEHAFLAEFVINSLVDEEREEQDWVNATLSD